MRLREIADERQKGTLRRLYELDDASEVSMLTTTLLTLGNPDCACSAAEKTISTYKAAADAITAEHATLQETAFASPRSKAARLESMRVRDLEAQNAELLARVEELESAQAEERAASDAARREMEKRHEAELNRRVKDATAIADRDLAELRQEGEVFPPPALTFPC